MEFLVKLIDVQETENEGARQDLQSNCTHVAASFWLFEGEEYALNDGINFSVVGEQAIEGYGDLSGSKLKKMVMEVFNIDKCFMG
ncbi:MAG: hypothetical protein WC322_05090 [Candidatus Paceibacterota bacterium]|jgi:hypothetical protein